MGSRPEKAGGGCKFAIHGLDPGIPVGMMPQGLLPCVLITPPSTTKPVLTSVSLAMIPKKAAFTQRHKGAKIFQSVSSAMPFT